MTAVVIAIGIRPRDVAPREAHAGAQVQADGDRAHAGQRRAQPGAVGACPGCADRARRATSTMTTGSAVRPQKQASAPASSAHLGADEDREIDVGGAGHKLRQGVARQELLGRPASRASARPPAGSRRSGRRRTLIMPMLTKLTNSDASDGWVPRAGVVRFAMPHSTLSETAWTGGMGPLSRGG